MIKARIHELSIGQKLSITCLTGGEVVWFQRNQYSMLPNETKSTLIIPSVKLSDHGMYFCHGKIMGSKKKNAQYFVASTEVKIYGEIGCHKSLQFFYNNFLLKTIQESTPK